MPRGPVITGEVRFLIAKTHDDDHSLNAPKVRDAVSKKLSKTKTPTRYPSLSAVQKELAQIRRRDKELANDPQDRPWSIMAMAQHDIPPEALPAILRIWPKSLELGKPMTIREARWIGRLYYVFKEQMPLVFKGIPEDKRARPDVWDTWLYLYALMYVHYEKIVKLIGYPRAHEDVSMLWLWDAHLAGDEKLKDKLEEGLGHSSLWQLLEKQGIDRKSWPVTAFGVPSMISDKEATAKGKRPGHGTKQPKQN